MQFENEYKKLNKQQQLAVDTLDGPVLVVAGPGTGKTQLLSMRVANILKQTDTDARNILCLTFTNKAATNMRQRLQALTNGEAKNVHIRTFHSFAAEIMSSYSQYFWQGANLQSAPDAVQVSILQTILSTLPLDNPYAVQFYGAYTMLDKAKKAIARAKEAGLTPEKLRVLVQANLAYIDEVEARMVEILDPALSFKKLPEIVDAIESLPTQASDTLTAPLIALDTKIKEGLAHAVEQDQLLGKTTHTGAWKKQWITKEDGAKGMHRERRRNQQYLYLADIYEQYRTQLHKRGFYDYADMLLEVIVQLENRSDLRAEVQEQFNYVLIDEFQDSNTAQLRLAHLIADHYTAENRPNIMAVGDDDQSIYGFNGAELNNMLHFNRTYGARVVKTIVLEENYRSTKQVLDTAETIIQNSQDRLVHRLPELTKKLVAKNHNIPAGEIIHLRYATKEQQYANVAKAIRGYTKKHPDHTIAVLARNHKSLAPMAAQLHGLDVSICYERQQNIFEHEVVTQIIAICRAVVAISSGNTGQLNATLATLLQHPMFSVETETLWQLAVENSYEPQWLSSLQNTPETQAIAQWLSWLAREATYQPLSTMFEHVLGIRDDSPQQYIKQYFVEDQHITQTYIETLSAIRLLREQVKDFSLQPTVGLADFLEFIDTELVNKAVLSDNTAYVSKDFTVELLSVHKAKGLEFDCVYIVDAVEKDWQPSSNKEGVPANLPLQPPLESDDEYTRLMYVATTRAKHSITFTSFSTNDAGEEVLPTPLIRSAPTRDIPLDTTEERIAILETTLAWPRLKATSEKEVLSGILDRFSINVTNLLSFLDVTEGGPTAFLEKSLLQLPAVKSDSMRHGSAIHSALELAQKLVNLDTFNLGTIKEQYHRELRNQQLSKDKFEQQVVYGEHTLDRLFNDFQYQLKKGSIPEQVLSTRMCGEARVGGKLDRIDFLDDNTIRIVDYKTGNELFSLETKNKQLEVKAWKHKTQLTFYALIAQCDEELSKYSNIEGQMIYVESKYKTNLELSYVPSQEEINRLRKIVTAVWRKVKNYELPATSTYEPTLAGIRAFEDDLIATVD